MTKLTTRPRQLEVHAFCQMIDVIRKAQGKPNPEDLPAGSVARAKAEMDVIVDTLRMLGIDPSDLG
ncbi:hypothetical protein NDK50_25295 [Paraburkholderia bryophila]|uniref:hypothetical protein n=1 Tax=Paraburkholderia bryophila TaxID=420952 RepID=UPI00234AC427|nr:hypothetical protein [Paraburkholderia bryophila]WCM24150.1 hypothetical protein NDK50_25295 [Paraburkholderia bryophila]